MIEMWKLTGFESDSQALPPAGAGVLCCPCPPITQQVEGRVLRPGGGRADVGWPALFLQLPTDILQIIGCAFQTKG